MFNKDTKWAPNVAVTAKRMGLMLATDFVKLAALTVGPPAVDANGWQVNYESTGKRIWRKRYMAQTMPAFSLAVILSAVALPVGVANLGAVHLETLLLRATTNAALIVPAVYGDDTTTTLTVAASTVDATTLASKVATADLFVTLAER